MATRNEEFFHDEWLGMVQTESDGLVVAKPVLLQAGCANRQAPAVQEKLRELCPEGPEDAPRRIADLMRLFVELLDFDADLFEEASKIPGDVSLYAPEGPQTIRPTLGLLRQDELEPHEGSGSPASNAATKYVALLWDVTEIDGEQDPEAIGLSLDKPETTTGEWSYPAAAKFDRLLRHCRVPVGILTNRAVIRLVYAPHGESSGHITFRVDDMATVGGRPILDAMIMLLCANQWFGVSDENSLPSLLKRSREYQGTVTEDLAEQVFSGLEQLLKGFQTAAERDRSVLLRQALGRDEDHLYRGLLTVMLRLVFILYAEDRGLLPVDHPLYAKRMSLLGLFERLQRDHGNFPDSMNNRFGAWGHIISLSRAIYLGVEHGDFHIPPRQGDLFDPHRYPFLEGWSGGSAPIVTQTARAEVKVPTVDDGTVFALLRSLLIFQGQRLSYRTLDVEQIGSVYEALMGYQVSVCESPAVAIKINGKRGAAKYWVEPAAVLARPAGQRVKWLKDECGFDNPVATKIKKALDDVGENSAGDQNAAIEALLPLAAGKKTNAHEQRASVGQYVLQPGSERRRSGTQYTPRALTEPIVSRMLEPLLRCLGEEPTAEQLLELKICDPAVGSGAFLVECCRQLADELEAAWSRTGMKQEIAAECPAGDVTAHARRLVAQRCLYGVDKNAMAVQLAKLSLWLFTLARELPFTFLDHSFRHGDSLVGLDLEQITAFHWKREKQLSFLGVEIKRALDEVVAIRQQIHALAGDSTPEGQRMKAQRLFDANDATEKVRRVADVCVGAFFSETKSRARLSERQMREERVHAWLEGSAEAGALVEEWSVTVRDEQVPFHWWLEFPEVFYEERSDPLTQAEQPGVAYMDAFIGNPPYLGGPNISTAHGAILVDWLKETVDGDRGNRGQIDLSAFFLRRAAQCLGAHGAFGFITTTTIGQGDTRCLGLKELLSRGWVVYDANTAMPWPGAAQVTVATLHAALGRPANRAPACMDGREVTDINSRLRPKPERSDPLHLQSNRDCAFQGVEVYGNGLYLSPEEALSSPLAPAVSAQLIQPFIGGAEINSSPTQSCKQYVINFGRRTLAEAEQWPELMKIVRERAKPERDGLTAKSAYDRNLRERWWQFASDRPEMAAALEGLDQCLVIPQQFPNHVRVAKQPTNRVFSQKAIALSLDCMTAFAVLQSRVHNSWVQLRCSRMGKANTPVYSLGECFKSFPFPQADPRAVIPDAEILGTKLYDARSRLMLEADKGLTKIYNDLIDPECDDEQILELRQLHEELDRIVLQAYGWKDVVVPPYCPMSNDDEVAIETFADEVIDRLYVLNAERVAGEMRKGLDSEPAVGSSGSNNPKKKTDTTMSLPGMGDAKGVS